MSPTRKSESRVAKGRKSAPAAGSVPARKRAKPTAGVRPAARKRGAAGLLATPAPVTVGPGTTIAECAQLMHDRHVGTLLVVEDTPGGPAPVGILTDRDITIEVVAFGLDASTLTARELMSAPVSTVSITDPPSVAIAAMRRRGVRRVAVVDEAGRLAGVLSADDVLGAMAADLAAIADAMRASRQREGKARSARAR